MLYKWYKNKFDNIIMFHDWNLGLMIIEINCIQIIDTIKIKIKIVNRIRYF
jgi:hypothetical protein